MMVEVWIICVTCIIISHRVCKMLERKDSFTIRHEYKNELIPVEQQIKQLSDDEMEKTAQNTMDNVMSSIHNLMGVEHSAEGTK